MKVGRAGAGGRPGLLAVLAALAVGVACVVAADPEKKDSPPEKNDAPPEKRVLFAMDGKPWDAVFKWLTDQTGKGFHYNNKPTGTFSYIGPDKKTYTVPEVIDIVNNGLLSNSQTSKYYLINGEQEFFVVPADEKIDPYLIPHIDGPEAFVGHGETELVQMELPLTSLNAEDMASRIGQIMGPFHESVAMPGNELHLQDTVRNLKRVVATLKKIEDAETKQTDSYSHECKYIRARDAERYLKTLLGEPQPVAQPQPTRDRDRDQPQPAPSSAATSSPTGPPMGPPMGTPGTPPATTPAPASTPAPMANPTPNPGRPARIRMFYITSDDAKNLVLVTGPPEIIAKAKDIVENRLDKPGPGQTPILIGPPAFKTIPVPDGNADSLAKDLSAIYPPTSTLRITAAGANALRVYACPEDMDAIEQQIALLGKGVKGVLIDAGGVDPTKAATTLQLMYGDPKSGGPYIEAQPDQNAVLVRGTPTQVQEIRDLVNVMNGGGASAPGVGPTLNSSNTRVITLENGSGAAVADELKRLLQQMRSNPVQVISPGAGPADNGDKKPLPPLSAPPPEMPRAPGAMKKAAAGDTVLVAQKPGDGPSLVDPQDKKDAKEDKPGSAEQPIIIAASGNKIIISSQDPAALAMAQQLVRLMTQTTAGEGDFEVIHLKNANAAEAAQLLDQAFNEPKPAAQQQQGPGGFFARFAAPQAQTPTNPTPNRIRVVADPTTNSLLVRAKPVDMLTVRWLLAKAIDNNEKGEGPRTRIIGPLKYARADDVYSLLAKVYQNDINQNPTLSDLQNLRGFSAAIASSKNNNLDANGQPRPVTLTLAVDDVSNSLIVTCTQAMYDDIKVLVDQMEVSAKDNVRTVRLVKLNGVDPALVQQAVDAFQGRTTVLPSSTGSSLLTPGGAGLQPGGNQPGGLQQGAGNAPGGGGQGQGPGRRRGPPQRSPDREGRGPDFFEHRVTDDPQPSLIYDPQQDIPTTRKLPDDGLGALQPARYDEPQPVPQPQPQPPVGPAGPDSFVAPRQPVTATPLEQLGLIVVSAYNPQDAQAIIDLIDWVVKNAPSTDFQIEMVTLTKGDATSIANTLTQLFQRVNVGPAGNTQSATVKRTTQTQQGTTTEEQLASVVLIPIPRLNALLVAGPKSRMKDIERHIADLDVDNAPADQATSFHLRKASAARVGTLLTNFYAQRYAAGNEGANQHQIRITFDTSSNVVFVVAAPADMAEIRGLIEHLDTDVSPSINNLRIKYLQHTAADDIAALLQRAISDAVAPPVQPPAGTGTGTGTGAGTGTGGGPGATPGGAAGGGPGAAAAGGGPGGRGPGGAPGGITGAPGATTGAAGATGATGGANAAFTAGATTKSTSLRFIDPRTGKVVESGLLEDIFITPDENSNSLLISAPDKTMELLDSLIDALDVAPAAQYVVKVLSLKKSDAAAVANMLQQLFLGTSGTGTGAGAATGAARPAGAAGPGTAATGGAPTGAAAGPTTGGTLSTGGGTGGNGRPIQLVLSGPSPGVQLTDLRITIDERSNSLIVAGGPGDIDIIQAIIAKLEASADTGDVAMRHNEVYKLKNSTAVDVANALNSFLGGAINVYKVNGSLTPFQDIEREVVVVPEPITNTLLISATPRYFDEVMRLIAGLDAEAPQVVVQVLIAEVDLTNEEEFGVELGLQTPVLFQRGIFPAPNGFGAGTVNYANATGGLVPPGVTINSSVNPSAQPGFNFNQPSLPLGNNPLVSPQVIGTQGLTNLGVGTVSPTQGVSGFLFQAQSDFFNLLIRALKVQGRVDVLSRPQVTAQDNQQARVFVGQNFPIVLGSTVTATCLVTNNINYQPVGVQLVITPRITPDGRVIMRVTPEVSSTATTNVSLGNGITATAINQQIVDTTVTSMDGETVALGGLITKRDQKAENKVPWLGDLPYLGAAFRYRTQTKAKSELLIIMTPHIVRTRAEADRVLAEESKRMDWLLADVTRTQGLYGMAPVLHPKAFAAPVGPGGVVDGNLPSPLLTPVAPMGPIEPTLPSLPVLPPPTVAPAPGGLETLPPPRVAPPGDDQGPPVPAPVPAPATAPPVAAPTPPTVGMVQGLPSDLAAPPAAAADPAPEPAPPAAEEPKQEKARWRLFRWN